MGIKPGMPNLVISKPSAGYCGLAIGLKIKPDKLKNHQRKVLEWLDFHGRKKVICYDFEGAKQALDNYLKDPCKKRTL